MFRFHGNFGEAGLVVLTGPGNISMSITAPRALATPLPFPHGKGAWSNIGACPGSFTPQIKKGVMTSPRLRESNAGQMQSEVSVSPLSLASAFFAGGSRRLPAVTGTHRRSSAPLSWMKAS